MPNVPQKQSGILIKDTKGNTLDSLTTNMSDYATGKSSLQLGLPKGDYFVHIYRPSYGNSEEVPYHFSIHSPDFTDDSFVQWEEKFNVAPTKTWDVTFNLPFDTSTILEKNLYVTNQSNEIIPLFYILDRELDSSTITLAPVKDYAKGETYTLWIKEIKGKNGEILKKNVKMNFTIAN